MLDLHKLEIFVTVARTGSFSAAAEQLLLSQPAVSQHVHDLEASLGTRLFVRSRRGVTPTPAGAQLHDYAQAIFRLVAEAENVVTDVANLAAGQLAVGATPGVSVYLLPEPIQEFHSRYPNLNVTVRTGITPEIMADLRSGRLDLGLIEGEVDEAADAAIAVQPLQVVEQLVVVGPRHPWWGRAAVNLAELDGQIFVMRQRHSQTRIWLDALLQAHGLHPRIGAEFDNVESIKRAVMNGTSVAILPDYAIRSEVAIGQLWQITLADEPLERVLKLIWSRERYLSPVARAFLGCAQRYAPALDLGMVG
jgi:DNA-binding transcriptional LysR family regulator